MKLLNGWLIDEETGAIVGQRNPVTGVDTIYAQTGEGGAAPTEIDFSAEISFDGNYTMPQHFVDGPLEFTADETGAVNGSMTYLRLVADGSNEPTFDGIYKMDGSADYLNLSGRVNLVSMFFDGTSYWYSITNAEGLTASPPVAPDGGVSAVFLSLTNLTNEGGGVYAATSAGTSQGAQGRIAPVQLAGNATGWIEVAKGAADGAAIITLDAATSGPRTYNEGDFIGQVNTAGALFYGANTGTLTEVAGYTLPNTLNAKIRLFRDGTTVRFQSTEDGGANWTTRHNFVGSSTAALQARWYTTYSTTPRRLYAPRHSGLT
jgi:hypothetical protein